jgi:hypothetical protein
MKSQKEIEESFHAGQTRILEMVASDASLTEILKKRRASNGGARRRHHVHHPLWRDYGQLAQILGHRAENLPDQGAGFCVRLPAARKQQNQAA